MTYVVSPADGLESNRVDVLVEDNRERDGEVEDVEALRAQAVRQDLDRVGDDEGRERETGGRARQQRPQMKQKRERTRRRRRTGR